MSWVRITSRHLARSLKILAVNALYAYIGIELVCRHTTILGIYTHLPIAWCYGWRSGESKAQYSNRCALAIIDTSALLLLTRHQPFVAVSFA